MSSLFSFNAVKSQKRYLLEIWIAYIPRLVLWHLSRLLKIPKIYDFISVFIEKIVLYLRYQKTQIPKYKIRLVEHVIIHVSEFVVSNSLQNSIFNEFPTIGAFRPTSTRSNVTNIDITLKKSDWSPSSFHRRRETMSKKVSKYSGVHAPFFE